MKIVTGADAAGRVKGYQSRHGKLLQERNWFDILWRQLSDHFQPRRSRFISEDRKPKRNDKMANNTPALALRAFRAGMQYGLLSGAWLRLGLVDPGKADVPGVREWLWLHGERALQILARSNFYAATKDVLTDLGGFGVNCTLLEDDDARFLWCYSMPLGTYALAANPKLEIDTVYHRMAWTVRQLVEKFGREYVSLPVRQAYDQKNLDILLDTVHVIEPRSSYDHQQATPGQMPFASCWYEEGARPDQPLAESGDRMFPCVTPRWDATGEDVYGLPPAFDALGDAKALQHVEKRRSEVWDNLTRPALQAPAGFKDKGVDQLPGGVYISSGLSNGKVERLFEVHPQALSAAVEEGERTESRIDRALFVDLFMYLLRREAGGTPPTAQQILSEKEEALVQIGPNIERVENEYLRPTVERVWNIMLERGLVEPAPPEIEGDELLVEFVSPLSVARRATHTSTIEAVSGYCRSLTDVWPDAIDKFDPDTAIDEYGRAIGAPPRIIRSSDEVAAIREQRAQQQQAAQMAAMAQPVKDAATAAKTLSDTRVDPDSVLGALAGAAGGA